MWQPSNGCQCEQKLTYLSAHLKREVIGLESLVSSGKCILEGVKHTQMIDISLSLCISVWSIGEGAPEETEKRDDSQRSTLFIEKPQSGSVSVGKCLETKSKATPRDTETEAERTYSSCDTRLLLSTASTCTDFSWTWTPLWRQKELYEEEQTPTV